jgi:hypothetical protein
MTLEKALDISRSTKPKAERASLDKLSGSRLQLDAGTLRKGLDMLHRDHEALTKTVVRVQKDITQLQADVARLEMTFPNLPPRTLQ